jgi:hypothetical protein
MDQPDVDRFVPRRFPLYFATLDSPMWRAIHGAAAAAASVTMLERREQPIGIKAHTKIVNELSATVPLPKRHRSVRGRRGSVRRLLTNAVCCR